MLVADCCRHGLLLWIVEDWLRWAFPSGTYYIIIIIIIIFFIFYFNTPGPARGDIKNDKISVK